VLKPIHKGSFSGYFGYSGGFAVLDEMRWPVLLARGGIRRNKPLENPAKSPKSLLKNPVLG
jgi:hypothetical protein